MIKQMRHMKPPKHAKELQQRNRLGMHYKNMPIHTRMKLKIVSPKNEDFQTQKSDIFHISVKKIDCV